MHPHVSLWQQNDQTRALCLALRRLKASPQNSPLSPANSHPYLPFAPGRCLSQVKRVFLLNISPSFLAEGTEIVTVCLWTMTAAAGGCWFQAGSPSELVLKSSVMVLS